MEQPLISVIIPTYNNVETIGVTLDSMRAQTYKNIEVIVVDDQSTDNTAEVVKNYMKTWDRLSYHLLPFADQNRVNKYGRNINAGYAARNYGFERSKGEWITFQDGDDASLANRIEAQYALVQKYGATHLCVDWQQFNPSYLGKKFDIESFMRENRDLIVGPDELLKRARRAKGILPSLIGSLHRFIPFDLKRAGIFNKLFFGTLEPYPGTGNSPLFKREVMEKIKFRPAAERVWPSFVGRGADRDFNFQVAETFKNSYVFFIPPYLWRQDIQHSRYKGIVKKYLLAE